MRRSHCIRSGFEQPIQAALVDVREIFTLCARLIAAEQGRSTFRMDGEPGLWAGDEDLGAPSGAKVEALLALSHEMRYRDPEGMRDLALSAVFVAQRMGRRERDRGRYTPTQIVDLQVRAAASWPTRTGVVTPSSRRTLCWRRPRLLCSKRGAATR
jgi:hypothetical protein